MCRPWTGKQVLCLATSLVSFGTLASMESSFVDLPATAIIFVGLIMKEWGRFGAFAAATLTRETSVLAAIGCLDWRRPFTLADWKRNLGLLTLAALPFALWMMYIAYRFSRPGDTAGSSGNFAWPLSALAARFTDGVAGVAATGLNDGAKAAGPFGWLYADESLHEILTVVALFCQGVYLIWRRDMLSPVWRTGICFAVLGCVLGPDVWAWTAAAAPRVAANDPLLLSVARPGARRTVRAVLHTRQFVRSFRRASLLGAMRLSVVVPCFNERGTIAGVLAAVRACPVPDVQVIVVDDGSTDGTRELLQGELRGVADKVLLQERNRGKGAALRAGFAAADGDFVVVQDADREYDPQEYPLLLAPLLHNKADVVYGSRFAGGQAHRVVYFWHMVGNRFLTLLSNMLTNLNLTDMETGFKMFRREAIQGITVEEDRFGFEPEITAKLARRGCVFYEVGISVPRQDLRRGKEDSLARRVPRGLRHLQVQPRLRLVDRRIVAEDQRTSHEQDRRHRNGIRLFGLGRQSASGGSRCLADPDQELPLQEGQRRQHRSALPRLRGTAWQRRFPC